MQIKFVNDSCVYNCDSQDQKSVGKMAATAGAVVVRETLCG